MQNERYTKEVLDLIHKDFDKPGIKSVIQKKDFVSFNELREYLSERLKYLLDHKFEKLINIIYTIDVDEQKVRQLFSAENKEDIPSRLADLIIERQIQKIHYRQKYKSSKN